MAQLERATSLIGSDLERGLLAGQIEASPDGVLVVSADGRIIAYNQRFQELWGIPDSVLDAGSDELAVQSILDRLVDPVGFIERIGYLNDHPDEDSKDELTLTRGLVIERHGGPLRGPEGEYLGRIWYFRDITGQKRAERRLAAQHELVRILAESPSLAVATPQFLEAICVTLSWNVGALWRVDRAANVLRSVAMWTEPLVAASEFDAQTRTLVLRPGEGLPGYAWMTREPVWVSDVRTEDRFPFTRVSAALELGLHGAIAFPLIARGEVLGVMEAFAAEVREPDDDLLEMVSALGSQIGQFIVRRQAEQSVREADARKSAILSAAIDCIITMDHEGRIREFNPAAERTFGFERHQVVGEEMCELIIPPHLREQHRRGLAKYLATGDGPMIGQRIQITAMRADGTEFPVELAITRVDLPGPPLFTGYLRDITEEKRAEIDRSELLVRERQARAEAELAQQRLAFLSEATARLASSLDYRVIVNQIVDLMVPYVADWCLVDVIETDQKIHRLAVGHADPEKADIADRMKTPSPDEKSMLGMHHVFSTGEAVLVPGVTDETVQGLAGTPERLATLRSIGLSSYMILPLRLADGSTVGAVMVASAESGRRYGPDDLALVQVIARRAGVAIQNARLYQERTYVARTLQQSLLPPHLPSIRGMELAACYEPAGEGNEVGGDFYDVYRLRQRSWGLVIGDVCGKGADAAAVTGLARYTLRAAAVQEREPSRILALLNEAMLRQGSGERFSTVAFARLEQTRAGARLTLACGGHPLPLLLRADGTVAPVGVPGTVLGVLDEVELADTTIELVPGDAIVFYTDGVTEARSGNKLFGQFKLQTLLQACAGLDAAAISERVRSEVIGYQTGPPRDDIAVLVLRVSPRRRR